MRYEKSQFPTKCELLSIVVPCYNEELNLDETLFRLESFVKSLTDFSVEVIFVDDGSVDSTLKILKNASQSSSLFKVVSFSRNFGHQLAVTAGVNASSGDAVVLMDADLQDPPEVIHQMIEKYREGYDVVYGTRTLRRGETFFKKITAKFFYKILNRLSDVPHPPYRCSAGICGNLAPSAIVTASTSAPMAGHGLSPHHTGLPAR